MRSLCNFNSCSSVSNLLGFLELTDVATVCVLGPGAGSQLSSAGRVSIPPEGRTTHQLTGERDRSQEKKNNNKMYLKTDFSSWHLK